jgi:hypothetical protein
MTLFQNSIVPDRELPAWFAGPGLETRSRLEHGTQDGAWLRQISRLFDEELFEIRAGVTLKQDSRA